MLPQLPSKFWSLSSFSNEEILDCESDWPPAPGDKLLLLDLDLFLLALSLLLLLSLSLLWVLNPVQNLSRLCARDSPS